ncbi:hypothetical protein UB45_21910 [Terrabacter sp. 28]|nr:hypothetical protein UB45_21910 [Terrabacter sp. 28]
MQRKEPPTGVIPVGGSVGRSTSGSMHVGEVAVGMPSDGPRVPVAALTRERVGRIGEAQAALRVGAGSRCHLGVSVVRRDRWSWVSRSDGCAAGLMMTGGPRR